MACEHFVYVAQSVIGTFVAPTRAIPVINAGPSGSQREVIDDRNTGSCRALHRRWLGAKPVGGSLVTRWWDFDIASIFKEIMTDSATTGAPSDYTHGFIFDDTAPLGMISAQFIHSTAMGISVLALVMSSIEIKLTSKELCQITFNWEARDKARSAAAANATLWDSLGTASPALVDPTTMYEALARPLAFYDGVIETGGTLAYTDASNTIAVTSGVALAKILGITINIDLGLDTDGYSITEDPTRQEFAPGNREITSSLDVSFFDQSTTLYDLANSGVPTVLSLQIEKSATLGAEIILPEFFLDPFALPDVSGDQTKKTYTLTGKAEKAVITGGDGVETDFNLIIKNQESSI